MGEQMKKEQLISIIIPVYNILDYLERCVKSVCEQTYSEIEIILVDDGSTDGTGELCDRLALTDERIRVFHKSNGGSSSARNLGIREAKGTYLGFVDSDDFIDSTMYEELMQAITLQDVKIAQVSRDEIDEQGRQMQDVCIPPEQAFFCSSETFMKELLLHRADCSFCTKLIEKELLSDCAFPEGKLNEDLFLLVHLLQKVSGVYIMPTQSYHVFYRIGSNTRTRSKEEFSRVYIDIVDNADYLETVVANTYPELKKESVRFALYQRLDYLLHIPIGKMEHSNSYYCNVKKYLRRHWIDSLTNPYLTSKNKYYLLLLTTAPKTVRKIHALRKGL